MDELNQYQNSLIDAALDEYPLTPLPPGFTNQVMSRVTALPISTEPIQFRLQFLDVVLSFFWAGILSLGLILILWLMGQLAAPGAVDLQNSLTAVGQTGIMNLTWLGIGGALLAVEILFVVVVCVYLWLDQPQFV